MSDKKVKIVLAVAVTFKGIDYPAGEQELPEDAAKLAVKKKLGTISGEGSDDQVPEDFKPLPFEEMMDRFENGDTAPEVFQSLKYYQPKMAAAKKAGMTLSEFLALEPAGAEGSGSKNEGLPENFPMRHVFEKLGFKTVEEVQAKSLQELVDLDGIAEPSATKALAYGK